MPQARLGLGVGARLEPAVRIGPQLLDAQRRHGPLEQVSALLGAGHPRGVDVPHARTQLALEAVLGHGGQNVHARARGLDGGHVGIQVIDRVDDDVELGVAQVGVDLGGRSGAAGGQTERAHRPLQVIGPVVQAQRQGLADGGLIDLHDGNSGGLQVGDLGAQSQAQLVGDLGARNVVAHEGPGHDRHRPGEHALHRLVRQRLGVGAPGHRHGLGPGDVAPQDGRTGAARSVGLDPSVLGGGESVEELGEVLDHVVALGLAVDQHIQADLLLEAHHPLDLGAHGVLVGLRAQLTAAMSGAGPADLGGLREGADGRRRQEGQAEAVLLSRLALGVGGAGAVGLGDGHDGGAHLPAVHPGVGGALGAQTGVLGELVGDRLAPIGQSACQDPDFGDLLVGEGEPGADVGGQ